MISGGSQIQIRGIAFTGCGYLQASAGRRGQVVTAEITNVDADRMCPANMSQWRAFSVTIEVPPGQYAVRMHAVGHDGVAHGKVYVE
jgi:hypothetical protein